MDEELNFHRSAEPEHEAIRIRKAYLIDGHITDPPLTEPHVFRTNDELSEDSRGNRFAKKVRDNLHHQKNYAPITCACFDKRGNKKPCNPGCKHR